MQCRFSYFFGRIYLFSAIAEEAISWHFVGQSPKNNPETRATPPQIRHWKETQLGAPQTCRCVRLPHLTSSCRFFFSMRSLATHKCFFFFIASALTAKLLAQMVRTTMRTPTRNVTTGQRKQCKRTVSSWVRFSITSSGLCRGGTEDGENINQHDIIN